MEHYVKKQDGVSEDGNPVLNSRDEETDVGYRLNDRCSPIASSDSTQNINVDESEPPDTICAPDHISSAEVCSSERTESSAALEEHRHFICTLGSFSTKCDTEFLEHTKACHGSEYCCSTCGKFFSSANGFVTHSKDEACEKPKIGYQCGVTGYKFETPAGQIFLHHVTSCRKGSTLMICPYCQKMFSVASCLIMHMQNEYPHKEKTGANPVQVSSNASTSASSDINKIGPNSVIQASSVVTQTQAGMNGSRIAKGIDQAANRDESGSRSILKDIMFCVHCQKMFSLASCIITHVRNECPLAGAHVNSNANTSPNSNHANKMDPSNPVTQAVTDGSCIAKDISSAADRDERELRETGSKGILKDRKRNDESASVKHTSDPVWSPEEIPSLRSVSLNSLFSRLGGLDITPQQNDSCVTTNRTASCPEGNESLPDSATSQICGVFTFAETEDNVGEPRIFDKSQCEVCSATYKNPKELFEHYRIGHNKDFVQLDNSSTANDVETEVSSEKYSMPVSPVPLEDIVTSSDSHILSDSENSGSVTTIEYESAVYKQKQGTSNVKVFEELKAPDSIVRMKEELKLKNFFKCMVWDCTFTTDNCNLFHSHLRVNHSGQTLCCSFCFKEFASPGYLTKHMLLSHGKRCYQCSACFYRAYSRDHVQIHIHHKHLNETAVVYKCTKHLSNGAPPSNEKEEAIERIQSYICATGDCGFQTFDLADFGKHNEECHRTVSFYRCFYCRAEFILLTRFMSHFRMHGMGKFHCLYWRHCSDTRSEMLIHVSQNHADQPLKMHTRSP